MRPESIVGEILEPEGLVTSLARVLYSAELRRRGPGAARSEAFHAWAQEFGSRTGAVAVAELRAEYWRLCLIDCEECACLSGCESCGDFEAADDAQDQALYLLGEAKRSGRITFKKES